MTVSERGTETESPRKRCREVPRGLGMNEPCPPNYVADHSDSAIEKNTESKKERENSTQYWRVRPSLTWK